MKQSSQLQFKQATKSKEIENAFNFNAEVFSQSPEFEWSLSNIKKKMKEGWELYSISSDAHIIAAALAKIDQEGLYTLTTPIKLDFQGHGYSHQIKDFFEKMAKEKHLSKVFNYCHMENFRLISLNETHGYIKTGRTSENTEVFEWSKDVEVKKKK
ncbi:MAG: hypothetical protein KBD63_06380 [Bacteriovoracaceae bacterium]|nr:hypothetical protein [Bacteriovoracaceae bacterium]